MSGEGSALGVAAAMGVPNSTAKKRKAADGSDDAEKKHKCNYCNAAFKYKSKLLRHLSDRHDVGVQWFTCDFAGCSFRTKQSSGIKRHKADMHGDKVRKFTCKFCYKGGATVGDCDKVKGAFKQASTLAIHIAKSHPEEYKKMLEEGDEIVVKFKTSPYIKCPRQPCTYTTTRRSDMNKHLVAIHDFAKPKMFYCRANCGFKSGREGFVKAHESVCKDMTSRNLAPDAVCSVVTSEAGASAKAATATVAPATVAAENLPLSPSVLDSAADGDITKEALI